MNNIVERMGLWGTNDIWDNGHIVMNPYAIAEVNEDFPHTYKELDDYKKEKVLMAFSQEYDKTLPIVPVCEIKNNIRNLVGRKYGKRVLYCFGEDLPAVNARFMKDIIENLDVKEIRWTSKVHPLLFKGTKGQAILLPVYNCYLTAGYFAR